MKTDAAVRVNDSLWADFDQRPYLIARNSDWDGAIFQVVQQAPPSVHQTLAVGCHS
jgi:hypothetical protein